MTRLYRFDRVAKVRCPWCGKVAAELWTDGTELREVHSDRERADLADIDPPNVPAATTRDLFHPYGSSDHPWCADESHRWAFPEHQRRRAMRSDTPINLQARRV